MSAKIKLVGTNGIVQITADDTLLSLIRVVKLSPLYPATSPNMMGAFISDYTPTKNVVVAYRSSSGWFRPLWNIGRGSWYWHTAPEGTKLTMYADREGGADVYCYIYDEPPNTPLPRPRAVLRNAQTGKITWRSDFSYMNVADVVGGYFQNLSQQFNYPVPTPGGNIAICPMAEAYQDEGVYVYDIGSGILYTQIDSYVSWFNTSNPTNAGVKLIGKSDDVMGDYFGMLGQRMSYQFLILRV